MKRLSLIFLLSAMGTLSFAQTDQAGIRSTFTDYFKLQEEMRIAESLEYIYPKLYELVPKETMIKVFEQTFEDTTIDLTMRNAVVDSVSEILEIEGVKYALLDYHFEMGMVFKENFGKEEGEEDSADESSEFSPVNFTVTMMKSQYGEENVAYDEEQRKILIQVSNKAYAILNPAYEGSWKFLDKKPNMTPILGQLFPQEVIDKW
ncbi:MAG: hypothetical protein AAFR61_13520 [Bacteroidota bacterium]